MENRSNNSVIQDGNKANGGIVYQASDLFKQSNEIMIVHDGEIYRVRITKNGKLIMNK